jgi:serine-type D-Ala-D-Ala carboxypeptidase/endopeptidase (penicillin-binding protein 4)
MKNLILSVVLILISQSCTQKAVVLPENHVPTKSLLQLKIDTLLNDELLKKAFVGIKIENLTKNEIVYELNSEKFFRPASNLKLLTTAAALEVLPANFQFKTQVLCDGEIINGNLKGNLYLKGLGDPLLAAEDLDTLAQNISNEIKDIDGNLVGDVSYFDQNYWGKGWMWDDEPEYFAPFITPLTVNSNVIRIFVRAGNNVGDSVSVKIEPKTNYITILNEATTSSFGTPPTIQVTRNWKDRENRILISGTLPIDETEEQFRLSLWKPELFALNIFRERLETYGVKINGKTFIDTTSHGKILTQIYRALDTVLFNINKVSNNLSAENLLKTLGAEISKRPGSAVDGINVVKQILFRYGVDTLNLSVVDGSGVSCYNLLSPNVFITLLKNIRTKAGIYERFYCSLPVAGVDGNLKNRMAHQPTLNNVHAKTGTHSEALALSGYMENKNSDQIIFSIIINNFIGDSKSYRDIIDKICELIASY